MLNNIFNKCAFFIRERRRRLIIVFRRYRSHFFICFACLALGMILAASKQYEGDSRNFMTAIMNGGFSPLKCIFNILFFTSLAFAAVFICGVRYYVYVVVGYGGLIAGSFLFWRSAFLAAFTCGFTGVTYVFIFIVPIFCFNGLYLIISLARVYEISGYNMNRRYPVNFGCHSRLIWRSIRNGAIFCLCFNLALWLIIMAVMLLIFAK